MLNDGQELWYVPRQKRDGGPYPVWVGKVGLKWADVLRDVGTPGTPRYSRYKFGRVNIATLAIDGEGYTSPGQCYLDRQAWEVEERRQEAWSGLLLKLQHQYRVPDGVSEEAIKQATALLTTLPTPERQHGGGRS